jgi:hypothetical protein
MDNQGGLDFIPAELFTGEKRNPGRKRAAGE